MADEQQIEARMCVKGRERETLRPFSQQWPMRTDLCGSEVRPKALYTNCSIEASVIYVKIQLTSNWLPQQIGLPLKSTIAPSKQITTLFLPASRWAAAA